MRKLIDRVAALAAHLRAVPPLWRLAALDVALFGAGLLCGWLMTRHGAAAAQVRTLAAQNMQLQQHVAVLERDQQVAQVADRLLQNTLAERDGEIRKLRADQAFYARLFDANTQANGLAVHDLHLSPVAHTRAWNFTTTLMQGASAKDEAHGALSLAIEGVRGGQLVRLDWATLAGSGGGDGLPYAFKYYQQVRGTLMLPAGFVPNRVVITLKPERGEALSRAIDWDEAIGQDSALSP